MVMRRNPDLIRDIALAVEKLRPGEALDSMPGVDIQELGSHVELMLDAGLIEGKVLPGFMGSIMAVMVFRLTWDGHDFLDAARSETLWKKAKDSVIAPTASWTFEILKEWLKTEIKNGLPTLRSLGN